MGQALYRKYRSKKLEEVVGQPHVTTTLANALKNNKISHAILLAGPRGVGKTSVARILAHEVNNLPYKDNVNHLDIIEIDAASNRRIDEIRDLRDKISIAPALAKYKVYIIDEVHMLTREAMSALLKTLEEPPAHAIFILATTESHKLPATIISRTQKFNFKPINAQDMLGHLKSIAKLEAIKIEENALKLIAEHGQGSFRDAISLLDQIRNIGKDITVDDVELQLGITSDAGVASIITALDNNDAKALITTLDSFKEHGVAPASLSRQISKFVRNMLISDPPGSSSNLLLRLLEALLAVPIAAYPYDALEIALLEYCLNKQDNPNVVETKPDAPTPQAPAVTDNQITPNKPSPKSDGTEKLWADTLAVIKQKDYSLYSLMRMAKPKYESENLILYFDFPFHQKKLSKADNINLAETTLQSLSGVKYKVTARVADGPKQQAVETPKETSSLDKAVQNPTHIKTISNIFGGAELLD